MAFNVFIRVNRSFHTDYKKGKRSPGSATITNRRPTEVSIPITKKVREVQGVPQSQTAALPRPHEEEETDKSKQAQTEQTYEKH